MQYPASTLLVNVKYTRHTVNLFSVQSEGARLLSGKIYR